MQLTPEQIEDAQKMATTPDLPNFSLPGTGKTHTALHAMDLYGSMHNLLIAPTIALEWWRSQAVDFLGIDAHILKTGTSPLVGELIITTPGIANNARERLYEHFDGGTLTVDESHYLANPTAARTQAVFGNNTDLAGGLAERFDTVWCMTGTPQQNHANDYYTQAGALHPDQLRDIGIRNYDDFCRTFTYKQQRKYNPRMAPVWKIVGSTNEAKLKQLIYSDIGAIRRKEISGLPGLTFRHLPFKVKLSKEIRDSVKDLTPEEILDGLNDKEGVIAKAWKASGLSKVDEVGRYILDHYKVSPILVGCWHRDVMQAYDDMLTEKGLTVVQVHGGTPPSQLDGIRNAFNAGLIHVILGQMRKMGVSWNLQEACNHIIIAEVHPSPAVIEQFYKRVYRRGQKQRCTVDMIIADNFNVDEALEGVRQRKEESIRKSTSDA